MMDKKSTGIGPIITGMIIIVLAAAAYMIVPTILRPTVNLQIGDGIFRASVAETQVDRSIVFSGSRNSNKALIKIFPYESKWKVTIKDINNAIDIIWLDKDKKVVFIMKNASSDTVNVDDFGPSVSAQYVVEVAAGMVDRKAVKIGSVAVFDVDESGVR